MRKKSNKPLQTSKVTKLIVKEETIIMDFLLQKMGGMSSTSIKSLLSHNQVTVNDKTVKRFDHQLKANDIVIISNKRKDPELKNPLLNIIFEDDDLIVVEKKEGLLTVTTGSGIDTTAFSILKEHVQQKSPENKIFTVHRLDKWTSGILIFAKNADAQHTLRDHWHNIVTKRTYIALVEGVVKTKKGKISSWLTENEKTFVIYSSPVDNGGKLAITNYKLLETFEDSSLLEIELETGRKNQIRVHMKDIGHPIVGDKKYGAKTTIDRLALHAQVLEFYHPTTNKLIHFESPIPKEFYKTPKLVSE